MRVGYERLIEIVFNFSTKEKRIAEFMRISNDLAVVALKKSMLAKQLLDRGDWEPMPHPKPSPFNNADDAKDSLQGDYWYDFFGLMNGDPFGKIENLLVGISSFDSELVIATYQERITKAAQTAYIQRSDWERYEGGGVFPDERMRSRWHELRCKIDEVNNIMNDIKAVLERKKDAWLTAIDEETRARLLKDIGVETLN